MIKKSVCKRLILVFLFLSIFMLPFVSADAGEEFKKAMQEPINIIKAIFSFKSLDKPGNMIIFLRVAIWILTFTVLWVAARYVPSLKDMRNATIVVAIVLASITTVFVPSNLLRTLGETYATLLIWVILGAPIVGALAIVFLALPSNSRWAIGVRIALLILVWWIAARVAGAWDAKSGLFLPGPRKGIGTVLTPIIIPYYLYYINKIKKKIEK